MPGSSVGPARSNSRTRLPSELTLDGGGLAPDRARGEPAIRVRGLSVRFGERTVLDGIDIAIEAGSFVGILGPNGCGKTTLLRCIAGLHRPDAGDVLINGKSVRETAPAEFARLLALQAQDAAGALGYSVSDVVGMGRLAHRRGLFSAGTAGDATVVEEAMRLLDVTPHAERLVETLSGGERQRVMIARAVAQQPSILLLDEPTNHLDVRHRFAVMDAVRRLGITVVATLHDIEFAARLCDRIVVLASGRIGADGTAGEALSSSLIEDVYGVASSIDHHPVTGQIRIDLQPLGGVRS
jgi:iron complex transport system ATP-binding protein